MARPTQQALENIKSKLRLAKDAANEALGYSNPFNGNADVLRAERLGAKAVEYLEASLREYKKIKP